MLTYRERKISFFGVIIIIGIIVLTIISAYKILDKNEVKKIEEINRLFGVREDNLVPENKIKYYLTLEENKNEYSEALITFVKGNDEKEKIERIYKNVFYSEEPCVTLKEKNRIKDFVSERNYLKSHFLSLYDESLDVIYWKAYITDLDTSEHQKIIDIFEDLPNC